MKTSLVGLATGLSLASALPAAAQQTLTGTVVDSDGTALSGVRVRVAAVRGMTKPTSPREFVTTGPDGTFSIETDAEYGDDVRIGLGKPGYMNVAGVMDLGGMTELGELPLQVLAPIDNVAYRWMKPFHPLNDRSDAGCNGCHGEQEKAWRDSEMAKSAKNRRVLSLYEGTDVDGNPAGEGFRLDNPDDAGPCANCHAPAAAVDAPGEVVLSEVEGIAKEGVFCDVCHKIADVKVDAGPGVGGSISIRRPSAAAGLFAFGPFDDVGGHPMSASYSELITTSRFCAGCHEWTNEAGVKVQSTFSEWSEMSGADPDALQCQDCHMKKKFGRDYRGEPEPELKFLVDNDHVAQMHGTRRWSDTMFPHTFHGGLEYADEAADLSIETSQEGGDLVVAVTVENANAGHALPTGMPFRHAILVVEASAGDAPLAQTDGPTVPAYGGEGRTDQDLAGLPGKGYAKVLGDGSGARNVPFWRSTEVIEDTRIRGGESDHVELRFEAPAEGGDAVVSARLVYRRAFREMVIVKRWDVEDIDMARAQVSVELVPPAELPASDAPVGGEDGSGAGPDEDGDGSGPAGPRGRQSGCGCDVATGAAPGLSWLLLLLGTAARRRRC